MNMPILLFLRITEEIFTPDLKQQCSKFLCQQINKASLKVYALLLAANNAWHRTVILPQEAFGIIAMTTMLTLNSEYFTCEHNISLSSPRCSLNMHSH